MPTPHFSFRLPTKEASRLREVAAIFYDAGTGNASRFVRELLIAAMSGNGMEVAQFLGRLQEKLNGQLQLEFMAAQERATAAAKPRLKRKRKGGSHGRATR